MEIPAAKRLNRHRVEECLGALRLLVVDQKTDEIALDLFPKLITAGAVEPRKAVLALYSLGRLDDATIVKVDAISGDVLNREPIACLEMPAARPRTIAKERVVLVEADQEQESDGVRRLRHRLFSRGR